MEDYLRKNADWTTATNQVTPLGAADYSSYLLNVGNSGADVTPVSSALASPHSTGRADLSRPICSSTI